jgi:hypothetical protein
VKCGVRLADIIFPESLDLFTGSRERQNGFWTQAGRQVKNREGEVNSKAYFLLPLEGVSDEGYDNWFMTACIPTSEPMTPSIRKAL